MNSKSNEVMYEKDKTTEIAVIGIGEKAGATFMCGLLNNQGKHGKHLVYIDEPSDIRRYSMILAVIDPLPEKLIKAADKIRKIKRLEEEGKAVVYLINKWNSGINGYELSRFLKTVPDEKMPIIDGSLFYRCAYLGKKPWESKEIKAISCDIAERLNEKFTKLSLTKAV